MNLFYPSHDIALGNGIKHFNPPTAAMRLQLDLAPIAEIWQKECTDDGVTVMPIPWAWDYDIRAFFSKELKYKLKDLPSDNDLTILRELSSRKTTIHIINKLKQINAGFSFISDYNNIDLPICINDTAQLEQYLETQTNFVLKTPWSSSGRGLSRSAVCSKETLQRHAASTIKKMGYIIAEKWYHKIQDFAMLFFVGRDTISFVGYSLFDNDEAGTYRSGKLMSNQNIEALLPSQCQQIKNDLLKVLDELFQPLMHKPWETGYIGIDMMVAKNEQNEIFVHPCVEMNVRCTMGIVARRFFDKNCSAQQSGELFITPALSYEKLIALDTELNSSYGAKYKRITEIHAETMFMAYVIYY